MRVPRAVLAALLLGTLPAAGCQLLMSPSDSVSGSIRAISGSFEGILTSSGSAPEIPRESYQRDLRQYTAGFVRAGGSARDFQRGISRIAELHGVTHWEGEPATPLAIGEGLRDADVSEAELAVLCAEIGAETPAAKLVAEGWRRAGG